jgi:hypothetical protein
VKAQGTERGPRTAPPRAAVLAPITVSLLRDRDGTRAPSCIHSACRRLACPRAGTAQAEPRLFFQTYARRGGPRNPRGRPHLAVPSARRWAWRRRRGLVGRRRRRRAMQHGGCDTRHALVPHSHPLQRRRRRRRPALPRSPPTRPPRCDARRRRALACECGASACPLLRPARRTRLDRWQHRLSHLLGPRAGPPARAMHDRPPPARAPARRLRGPRRAGLLRAQARHGGAQLGRALPLLRLHRAALGPPAAGHHQQDCPARPTLSPTPPARAATGPRAGIQMAQAVLGLLAIGSGQAAALTRWARAVFHAALTPRGRRCGAPRLGTRRPKLPPPRAPPGRGRLSHSPS